MFNQAKIMIIDDSEIDCYVLNRKLSRLGENAVSIIEYHDGDEALNYLSECVKNDADIPEVIFLDVDMPKMGGFEFLARFSPMHQDSVLRKSKVMMYSSSERQEDKRRAFGFPCVKDFINKGKMSVDDLELKMNQLLNEK